MKLLIKKATIADPSSPFNGQIADLLISDSTIVSIAPNINTAADRVIDITGLHVSPGWIDSFCQFHDPGAEHKETLESGANAAAAGGFTDVFLVPNTSPAIHSKSQVAYIINQAASFPATLHPLGAISKNCEGKELAEMFDMRSSGAVAFTDGLSPVQSPQVMLKALQYIKAFNAVLIQLPDDLSLTSNGLMNEGLMSTRLGLPGKPAIAETLVIARDIELLRYTGSRLHITGVSTAAGIQLIRKAKEEGLDLSCSVTPYHLTFNDEDLASYDTNLKVNPSLRTVGDVDALRQAVLDGTVDCISSHHLPQDWDNKICEFEYARYGMEGLESSAAAVASALPGLQPERFAELFSLNAARIFGLGAAPINEGANVSLTLFAHTDPYIFSQEMIRSNCSNNAFLGREMALKVIGTVKGNRLFLN